jgi:hypothetical protein
MSNNSSNGSDAKGQFTKAWNNFSVKYNALAELIESKGISSDQLKEVTDLKSELTKKTVILKMDELFKI